MQISLLPLIIVAGFSMVLMLVSCKEDPKLESNGVGHEDTVSWDDADLTVEQFDELITQLREELEKTPSSRKELEEKLKAATDRLETIRGEIDDLKALANKRKDEIDEWKKWYAEQPEDQISTALEKMQSETKWRADELNAMPGKFDTLAENEEVASNEVEQARQRLNAFDSGVPNSSVDEDPRLRALLEARENAVRRQGR